MPPPDAGCGSLLVLVGPTAVGKSRLAVELASRLGAEIISADSRQVYRHLDIGTAKPSAAERRQVPHHLIDIAEPDHAYTVAEYVVAAGAAIAAVRRRGRLPLLVGGSGLYVRAVTGGLQIPQVAPDPQFRRELETRAAAEGPHALHGELQRVDPVAAARIDPRNVRRTIRALEVARTQPPLTVAAPPVQARFIGLRLDRTPLYQAIDRRVDSMVARGLVEEVAALHARGLGWDLPAMTGIGYRQFGAYLRGEQPLAEAIQQTKYATHRLVRQQATWFRRDDPQITWFDAEPREGLAAAVAARWEAGIGPVSEGSLAAKREPFRPFDHP